MASTRVLQSSHHQVLMAAGKPAKGRSKPEDQKIGHGESHKSKSDEKKQYKEHPGIKGRVQMIKETKEDVSKDKDSKETNESKEKDRKENETQDKQEGNTEMNYKDKASGTKTTDKSEGLPHNIFPSHPFPPLHHLSSVPSLAFPCFPFTSLPFS